MVSSDFYTDRVNGPVPRTHDALPKATSEGLYSLFRMKAQAHWFAQHFPDHCDDGNGICGTDQRALWNHVRALVPQLKEPDRFGIEEAQPDGVVFDLMEYAAAKIAKPIQGEWHSFMRHYELTFAEEPGRKEFRADVNQLLQRGGTMYELDSDGRIVRIGTPEVRRVLEQMTPASGDDDLDRLLARAADLYRSRKIEDRASALEKLWDAFERLKTIDVVGNKKQSAEALLDNVTGAGFREVARDDMKALTDLGNRFMIRHHETDKLPVPAEAQDYLCSRIGSLIVFLLKVSGRLR